MLSRLPVIPRKQIQNSDKTFCLTIKRRVQRMNQPSVVIKFSLRADDNIYERFEYHGHSPSGRIFGVVGKLRRAWPREFIDSSECVFDIVDGNETASGLARTGNEDA